MVIAGSEPGTSRIVPGDFKIKDSGQRQEFEGGMVRDTSEGKINFLNVRFGPMLRRWAQHLTGGRNKYPDPRPGVPNWTLASGVEEYLRFKESAARHFEAWLAGERDEDHAAGVFFNINGAEFVLEHDPTLRPGLGATTERKAALDPFAMPGTIIEYRPSPCVCGANYPHSHVPPHWSEHVN